MLKYRPRTDKKSKDEPAIRWSEDIKTIFMNWVATAQSRKTCNRLEKCLCPTLDEKRRLSHNDDIMNL